MKKSRQRKVQPLGYSVPECPVSKPLSLVLRVSQLAGVAPLTFRREGGVRTVRVSPTLSNLAYIGAAIMTITSLTCLAIVDHQLLMIDAFTVYGSISSLSIFVVITTTYSVVVLTAPSRMKTLIQCLRNIEKVKTTLNNTSIKRYAKQKIAVILYILYGVLTMALEMWLVYVYEENNFGMMCLNCACAIQAFIIFLAVLQFAVFVLEVNYVLQDINDALLQLLLEKKGDVKVASKIKTPAETVQKVSIAHRIICDVIEDFNRSNGCVIVATLLMSLMDLTLLTYTLVGPDLPDSFEGFTKTIRDSNWIFFYTSRFLLLVEPCHATHCKLSRTRRLVSKLYLEYADQPTSEELNKFHHRLQLDQVSFSPMDVCTLHRPLTVTMAATIATYLVIITQYRELDYDNGASK